MTTSDDSQPKSVVRCVELVLRLLEPKEPPQPKEAPPSSAQAPSLTDFLDPAFSQVTSAPVFWRLPGGEESEIPFRDAEELRASLEFEYVLGGAASLDRLVRQLDVAALRAIARYPSNKSIPPESAGTLILEEVGRHRSLLFRLRVPMLVIPWEIINNAEPAAWTSDLSLQLSLPAYKRLVLDADDAVSVALQKLQGEIHAALQKVEKFAKGMLITSLDSSGNEIYREALRYFDFKDQGGVEAALAAGLKHPFAKAEKDTGAKKPSDVKKFTVAKIPAQLQKLLTSLKPFADEVLNAEEKLTDTSEHVYAGGRPVGPNPEHAKAKARVANAKETLAKELGKFRETYPVVLRMTAKEIVRAPAAHRDELGAILFPILSRAHAANQSMKAKAEKWPLLSAALTQVEWADVDLTARLKRDTSIGSVWRHRKYVERAVSRVFPEPSSVGHVAAQSVLDGLYPKNPMLGIAADIIRDLAIFQVAGKIDKHTAAKGAEEAALGMAQAGARKLPRLVPVVNWVFAGYQIYADIRDFGEESDRFYCTLDPTDSLADIEPSFGSLLGDIAMEVAFALI